MKRALRNAALLTVLASSTQLLGAAADASASRLAAHERPWNANYDPIPDPEVVIHHGNARFSVLKDAVVRMEYSAEGTFDDSPTISMLHRRFPIPDFESDVEGTVLTITTSNYELKYDTHPGGVKGTGFSAASLSVKLRVFPYTTWTPEAAPTANLHGTIRTLDRVGDPVNLACPPVTTFMIYYSHCDEGLASRDGWALVDDTYRPRWDKTKDAAGEWTWVRGPPPASLRGDGSYTDMYLFAHGRNYTASLGDYVSMSGPIPMSPRYALGPGFSRWFQWSDVEELAIVQQGFSDNGIPLDALSIDMDWHYTYPRGLPNPYGVQVEGWTGYTIYPFLFPTPKHFLHYLQRRGVYVNFNMHPAAGIEFHEDVYPTMAAAQGVDPTSGKTIEFDISNVTFARNYFNHVIGPIDEAGVKYWWIDWQQGPFTPIPFVTPTFMTNYAWWTSPYRYGPGAHNPATAADRPFLMGRWGGLGGHRYPIGFVGDTYVKWDVLRYEAYFMPTASNVAFQWTHDIGGFEGTPEPGIFTRWVQFGTFSPMLRTHSSKRSPARSVWTQPYPYSQVMRQFYRLRARLVPYTATSQRIAHDTGVQIVRPMYYAYPNATGAYGDQGLHQFFFGPDMWVAPIAAPTGNATTGPEAQMFGLVNWTMWVPPTPAGEGWIEWGSWERLPAPLDTENGYYTSRNYTISEVPVFTRPGSIIPMRTMPRAHSDVLGLASKPLDDATLYVLPPPSFTGSLTRATRLYEDDGATVAYMDGAYTWTPISCTWSKGGAGDETVCTVSPPEGAGYAGAPTARRFVWRFIGSYPPATVTVNGVAVELDPYGAPDAYGDNDAWSEGANAWSYDGSSLSTWVRLGAALPVGETLTLTLTYPAGVHADDAGLTSGMARKVARALGCKEEIDKHYGILFPSDVEPMLNITAAASRMSAAASAPLVKELLAQVPGYLSHQLAQMNGWRVPAANRAWKAHQRCLGRLQDAASKAGAALKASDARRKAAEKPIAFKYLVGEHLEKAVDDGTGTAAATMAEDLD